MLFLLAAPFAVGAAIGGWLFYQYRRSTRSRRPQSSVVALHPAVTSRKERT
jgi:hypothetical protein